MRGAVLAMAMGVARAACGGGSSDRAPAADADILLGIAAAFSRLTFDRPLFLDRSARVRSDGEPGRLRALRPREGAVAVTELGRIPGNPTSFGEDSAGELYVTSFDGSIYRLQQP